MICVRVYYFVYFVLNISKSINKSMIRKITQSLTTRYTPAFCFSSHGEEGTSFLTMVNSYFDKAGIHTGIRSDYLNFYKKPDNVVKCTFPIVRGTFHSLSKKMEPLKPSLPTDANIRHINSPLRVEQDMLIMSASSKLRPSLVL